MSGLWKLLRVLGWVLLVAGALTFLATVYIWLWTGGSDDVAPLPWWNEPLSMSGFLTAIIGGLIVTAPL